MTLPATGSISLSQVNVELGRAASTRISLGETAVRNLAGVSSGTIGMSHLRGKSNVRFWYDGHGFGIIYAETSVHCTVPAAWYVNGAYHSTSKDITFSVSATPSGSQYRSAARSWTVYGVANGITSETFYVECYAEGTM